MNEKVYHPSHYNSGKIEAIDYIEDQNLNFSRGNAIKYITRAAHKGTEVEDLKKAVWYVTREVQRITGTIGKQGHKTPLKYVATDEEIAFVASMEKKIADLLAENPDMKDSEEFGDLNKMIELIKKAVEL